MSEQEPAHVMDPVWYRDTLARAYGAAPGPVGAGFMTGMLQELHDTMLLLYGYAVSAPGLLAGSRLRRLRIIRTLRSWKLDLDKLGDRIEGYWSDSCLSDDPCPGEDQPEYTTAWVGDPILRGEWPEDYYLGLDIPPRSDAEEAAMLWNQIVAVDGTVDELQGSLEVMFYSWADRVKLELLEHAAPGEDPTVLDDIEAVWEEFKRGAADLVEGVGDAMYAVGVVLTLVLAFWGYKKVKG